MWIPATSNEVALIPITVPPGVNPTSFTPRFALAPDDGTEPAISSYQPGVWANPAADPPEAGVGIGPAEILNPGPGLWMLWVYCPAADQQPVMRAGRVRIGDTRF